MMTHPSPDLRDQKGPKQYGWLSKVNQFLTSVFVVDDADWVREDSIDLPAARSPPSEEAASEGLPTQTFSWGSADGDDALRLPQGVAAAERLLRERQPGSVFNVSQPALREEQVVDAKKSPAIIFAVFLTVIFQTTGSLIGLSREVLPGAYLSEATVDADVSRTERKLESRSEYASMGVAARSQTSWGHNDIASQ
jgi:hypothetical protein